jgi:hypothetical protein
MSDTDHPDGPPNAAVPDGGVLAGLPRTRPQRASPRRAAARNKASKPGTGTSGRADAKLPSPAPTEPPAPKQGYEPEEEEIEPGGTVNPPSGTELVESLADIVSELASSGLTAGGRLLKDAFSILRRP